MRLFAVFAVLLVLLSFSAAFSVEEYLTGDEKPEDVSVSSLDSQAGSYSLINVKGKEYFLVKNNSFVVDADEISTVLSEYYFKKNYPNASELDEVVGLVRAFNTSRDQKSTYGLLSESTCKRFTGLDRNPCFDRNSCITACLSVYSLCSPFLYSSGEPFISGLIRNGEAMSLLDLHTVNILSNVEAMRGVTSPTQLLASNVSGLLTASKNDVSRLTYAVNSLKDNKLMRNDCPSCYDFCPAPTENLSMLEELSTKITLLQERVAPISSVPSIASQIQSTTSQRVEYLASIRTNSEYEALYGNASVFLANVSEKFASASVVINAPDTSTQLNYMTGKLFEVRRDIDAKNFSRANYSLKQFYAVGEATRLKIENYSSISKTISNARDNASVLLLRADWELEPQNILLESQLQKLESRKASLDIQLYNKTSPENASVFIKAYSSISEDAEAIIATKREQAHDYVFDAGLGVAKFGVNGVVGVLSTVLKLSFADKKNYSALAVPAAVFLAWVAVALFALVSIFSYVAKNKVYRNKARLVLWTFLFITLFFASLLLASSAVLLFQNQASSSSLDSFLSRVESHDTVFLVRDYRLAANPELITSCSSSIQGKLKLLSKNVTVYSFNAENCESSALINGSVQTSRREIASCAEDINELPAFYVAQSDANSTVFRTFYELDVTAKGDAEYLRKCDLARVMSK
ncbi:hypothetical protein HY992_01230 [Candidatus Micrarchaeota archaeon]|nr:hypothetical protein [Candidatus Micrarchaeota archaeon]